MVRLASWKSVSRSLRLELPLIPVYMPVPETESDTFLPARRFLSASAGMPEKPPAGMIPLATMKFAYSLSERPSVPPGDMKLR